MTEGVEMKTATDERERDFAEHLLRMAKWGHLTLESLLILIEQQEAELQQRRRSPPSGGADREAVIEEQQMMIFAATMRHLKQRIDYCLNDHLCEMKEGYDDSISGFNDAWDIVRKIFEESATAIRALKPTNGKETGS